MTLRPVELEVLASSLVAAAEEMGIVLARTAFSPNIKERHDHSCALFDADGRLAAQADHIPVHLGAMTRSVEAVLARLGPLDEGDVACVNDPYEGGTHLPDLTLVAPIHHAGERVGYAADRAHHADVGGMVPGSMPARATEIFQEGLILPPVKLVESGRENAALHRVLFANVRTSDERRGDLAAQRSALAVGARRVGELARRRGARGFLDAIGALADLTEARMREEIARVPRGTFRGEDALEGDGVVDTPLPIRVAVESDGAALRFDFAGTAAQSRGNVNAPVAVAEACVQYVVRALLAPSLAANVGMFRPVEIHVPEGTLLSPQRPAAVAAGNVETSQRTVDALLVALAPALPERVPAASQGTMNNLTLGGIAPDGRPFTYYETIGGGQGGGPRVPGMSGVHTHMTNTLNTPVEALEQAYPLRVLATTLARGSGGTGARPGGDGIVRSLELVAEHATLSLLTDRRATAPPGLAGGEPGARGRNVLRCAGTDTTLPSKCVVELRRGDTLVIETPGGGGHGRAEAAGLSPPRSTSP
ncbi:MAG: hydantoinase B/oxoprolinase family protein [Thermoplasmatota archaeon]